MGEIVEREKLLVLPIGDERDRDLDQAGRLTSPGISYLLRDAEGSGKGLIHP